MVKQLLAESFSSEKESSASDGGEALSRKPTTHWWEELSPRIAFIVIKFRAF